MQKIVILCFCFFYGGNLFCGVDNAKIFKPLETGQVIKANFSQKRIIKGIPKPLLSKGNFVIYSGKGLIWSVSEPFVQSTLLSNEGIFSIVNNKKSSLTKKVSAQHLKKISELLGKILSGDFQSIDYFEIEDLTTTKVGWKKRLIPKNENIQKIFKSIEVEGNQHIECVTMRRPNDDSDVIHFSEHQIFASQEIDKALDQQQKQLFN